MNQDFQTVKITNDTSKLQRMLGKNLYRDSFSFIREVVSNATDAHRRVGIQKNIKVLCYTNKDFFQVIDSGSSMTRDEFLKNIGVAGHSDKEQEKVSIGGYGIGTISFTKFTNSCSYVCVKNGKKFTGLLKEGLNEELLINASEEIETNEENGVTWTIDRKVSSEIVERKTCFFDDVVIYENDKPLISSLESSIVKFGPFTVSKIYSSSLKSNSSFIDKLGVVVDSVLYEDHNSTCSKLSEYLSNNVENNEVNYNLLICLKNLLILDESLISGSRGVSSFSTKVAINFILGEANPTLTREELNIDNLLFKNMVIKKIQLILTLYKFYLLDFKNKGFNYRNINEFLNLKYDSGFTYENLFDVSIKQLGIEVENLRLLLDLIENKKYDSTFELILKSITDNIDLSSVKNELKNISLKFKEAIYTDSFKEKLKFTLIRKNFLNENINPNVKVFPLNVSSDRTKKDYRRNFVEVNFNFLFSSLKLNEIMLGLTESYFYLYGLRYPYNKYILLDQNSREIINSSKEYKEKIKSFLISKNHNFITILPLTKKEFKNKILRGLYKDFLSNVIKYKNFEDIFKNMELCVNGFEGLEFKFNKTDNFSGEIINKTLYEIEIGKVDYKLIRKTLETHFSEEIKKFTNIIEQSFDEIKTDKSEIEKIEIKKQKKEELEKKIIYKKNYSYHTSSININPQDDVLKIHKTDLLLSYDYTDVSLSRYENALTGKDLFKNVLNIKPDEDIIRVIDGNSSYRKLLTVNQTMHSSLRDEIEIVDVNVKSDLKKSTITDEFELILRSYENRKLYLANEGIESHNSLLTLYVQFLGFDKIHFYHIDRKPNFISLNNKNYNLMFSHIQEKKEQLLNSIESLKEELKNLPEEEFEEKTQLTNRILSEEEELKSLENLIPIDKILVDKDLANCFSLLRLNTQDMETIDSILKKTLCGIIFDEEIVNSLNRICEIEKLSNTLSSLSTFSKLYSSQKSFRNFVELNKLGNPELDKSIDTYLNFRDDLITLDGFLKNNLNFYSRVVEINSGTEEEPNIVKELVHNYDSVYAEQILSKEKIVELSNSLTRIKIK